MVKLFAPWRACTVTLFALLASLVVSAAEINLLWDDNSSTELGFKLERSSAGLAFTQIAALGSNTTTYTDTGLGDGVTYSYRVRAYNSFGNSAFSNTFEAVARSVASRPFFIVHPLNQAFGKGGTIALVAAAIGSSDIVYQWNKNGVPLHGFRAPTLTLPGASSNDPGIYTVVATNSAGSTTSQPALVTIIDDAPSVAPPVTPPSQVAPVFTVQPLSQTFTAGGTITLITAATGSPPIAYQWYKNGAAVGGFTAPTFSQGGASANDQGTYTVVATNAAGSTTSQPAQLTLANVTPAPVRPAPVPPPAPAPQFAPVFTVQPVSQTFTAGGTITLISAATGSPPIAYQWYKNGAAVGGFTAPTFSQSGASSNDPGLYTVVATNAAGSTTSQPALLTIVKAPAAEMPPTFIVQPLSLTIANGGIVYFVAEAAGSPTITYQWFRNGHPLHRFTEPEFIQGGASHNDIGIYTVVATNAAGSTTSDGAALIVR